MSDLIVTDPQAITDSGLPLKRKFIDQSDGTWAEKIAGSGGSGTSASQSLGAYQTVTLQNAASATGNGTSINLSGMGTMNVAITGTFVGTITFEAQDASGSWSSVMLQAMGTTTLTSSTSTTGVWRAPIGGYSAFRARISAYTSGAITVTAFAENTAYTPAVQNVGFYEKLDATNDAIRSYPHGGAVTVISTATTTTVKSGAGIVREIRTIGGTLGNVTVYDNTAGSGTAIVPTVTPDKAQMLIQNGAFSTGLTIVTAAATLLVVVWE